MEEDQYHLNYLQQHDQYNEGSVIVSDFGLAPTTCYHPSNAMQPAEINYVRNPNSAAHHFDLLIMARQQQNYQLMQESADHHQHQLHEIMMHNKNNINTGSSTSGGFATENASEANVCDGGGGGGRWPRQETLTLLEIRSRLDHKFKEANQKGPLWDEISRILSDEHGYQRSGKKCREKFENLYKYYKKTKEGKAGRQDGKHYRFFRQLEALYGETKTSDTTTLLPLQDATRQICFDHLKNATSCSNPANTLQLGSNNVNSIGHRNNFDSLSLSCNSSDFNTSSSEENGEVNGTGVCENGYSDNQGIKKRRGRRKWKAKIKEFIDSQIRSLIEIQEVWMCRVMKTMEQTEQERVSREEEWKKRMDEERKFWASERQWIQERDANLMEALRKIKGGAGEHMEINHNNSQWEESEITKLVQLRATMEPKFELFSGGCDSDKEFILWGEIATRMASLGSNKSSLMCKNKWDSINSYLVSRPTKNIDIAYKKHKGDNSRSLSGCYNNGAGNVPQVEGFPVSGRVGFDQTHNYNMSYSNISTAANNNNNVQQQDQSFFRFLVDHEGGSENLWGNSNL